MTQTHYRLFHRFKGDKFHEPSWVHSGDFDDLSNAEAMMSELWRLGYRGFRLLKVTTEKVEIQGVKAS